VNLTNVNDHLDCCEYIKSYIKEYIKVY